jgi:hypothetical protein
MRVIHHDRSMRRTRSLVALLAVVVLAACTGTPEPDPGATRTTTPATGELQAFVASYDLSADRPVRVMVGLVSGDGRVLSHGSVEFAFAYLGRTQAGTPEPGPEAEAVFLPVPGEEASEGDVPTPTPGSEARGVYAAQGVELDRAGVWQVEVSASVEGEGEMTGVGTFTVLDEPQVPVPGEPAPRTVNHLPGAKGVPPGAIDSRSETAGEVPDPILHRDTIAGAIRQQRPVLVIFSTPVYCVSRFCGPVTDVIEAVAKDHQGDAAFIHVEIWRDFEGQVLNRAAVDWIGDPTQGETLQEPWLFLVGRDGRVVARWDNLFDVAEVERELARATNG